MYMCSLVMSLCSCDIFVTSLNTIITIANNSGLTTLLVRPCPSIISTAREVLYKETQYSRTCLIGYSDFILCEWFIIAQGVDTQTNKHAYRLPRNKLTYYHLKTRRHVQIKPLLIYCYSMYYNSS